MCSADCNQYYTACTSKMSKLCAILGVLIVALQLGSTCNGVKGKFKFVNV